LVWCDGSGQFVQLAKNELQRPVMGECHPVRLPGVASDVGGERIVVAGVGLVSALAGERSVHDFLVARLRMAA
jgi:hypothetical protein